MSAWVEELPGSLLEDLCRDGLPDAAAAAIVGIARIYRMRRDDKVDEPTRSEIREDLERLENIVLQLKRHLTSGSHETIEAVHDAAFLCGCPDALDELAANLATVDRLIGVAWQRTEPADGRPASLRTWLSIEIANVLERHNLEPTPRKSGALYKALRRVLTAVGEGSLHFERIAKTALERRDKNMATAQPV